MLALSPIVHQTFVSVPADGFDRYEGVADTIV
jgi:hypothetical protein